MLNDLPITFEIKKIWRGMDMLKYRIRLMMQAMAVVLSAISMVSADTWRLEKDQGWKAVTAEGRDKFLLAVTETKKLVNTGQTKAARQAFDKLKKDFPEIAGPDLDVFIKAEMLFCAGKFTQAVDNYEKLITKYPDSALRDAALDRQFSIATAFLGGQKKTVLGVFEVTGYAEGLEIMKRISEQAPDTPIGTEATVAVAQQYEEKGEFTKALRIYEKLLTEQPDSDFRDQVMDRQYAIATAYLGGQKKRVLRFVHLRGYAEGVRIMEKITDRAGLDTPMGLNASISVAEHYERKKEFNAAYLKWWEISSQYQTGKTGRNALLNMARCKHAAYNNHPEHKRAFYDASSLSIAKSCYEKFKLLYPGDTEEIDVDEVLKEINEQLAYKQFSIGQYYQRTGNKKSANLYFDMVVNDWSGTKAAEMAKEMLSENSGGNERENEEKES
ncbi:MAG: tetratricopeptide repeat protein [Sedimentisphaerales bacterium]|nr:tetratricopeptide repeat protein [Sedimentisphaerales bacterium]